MSRLLLPLRVQYAEHLIALLGSLQPRHNGSGSRCLHLIVQHGKQMLRIWIVATAEHIAYRALRAFIARAKQPQQLTSGATLLGIVHDRQDSLKLLRRLQAGYDTRAIL